MATPVILDTDTAQDDCLAIALAFLDPRIELRAITLVGGNVNFEQQTRNTHLTLNMLGALGAVPIYQGSSQPLMRELESAEYVHGDGIGGLTMDFSEIRSQPENGIEAMVRMAAASPGQLTVIAIGPLTNIALAAQLDPQFPSNVARLVVMGGSNNGRGNVTAAAEFNFYVDPEAAKAVFDAGFDVTVVTWDPLTLNDAVFHEERLRKIAELGTPLSRFFGQICASTLEYDRRVGIDGTTHPDSLSVAIVADPSLVTADARYNVDVETVSDLTRGYSAMSWGVHDLEPNATVIESVDGERFFDLMLSTLGKVTVPTREVQGWV